MTDTKSFPELIGSGNPENGDYLAGLREAKPMTMVERVAQAIRAADDMSLAYMERTAKMARAAIEAMREPTSKMVEEGLNKPKGMMDWRAAVACSWRVMVDEALKE